MTKNDFITSFLACSVLISVRPLGASPYEQAKLIGSDTDSQDNFGYSVSLFQNTALVSARSDWTVEDDPSTQSAGSAYVFERSSAGTWSQSAQLIADDGVSFDVFGTSVALWDTTAVVGSFAGANDLGAAYVFEKDEFGAWSQVAKLTGIDTAGSFERFGQSVAVSGRIVLVGYGGNDLPVAVFRGNESNCWSQVSQLMTPSDLGTGTNDFGGSLSLDGARALVGAARANNDDSGAAYLFEEDEFGDWPQVAKLNANDVDAGDRFGRSVSLHNSTALVGAPSDDEMGLDSGAAYVFRDDGAGNWNQIAKLTPLDPDVNQGFGWEVSLFDNFALVGAIRDDQHGTD